MTSPIAPQATLTPKERAGLPGAGVRMILMATLALIAVVGTIRPTDAPILLSNDQPAQSAIAVPTAPTTRTADNDVLAGQPLSIGSDLTSNEPSDSDSETPGAASNVDVEPVLPDGQLVLDDFSEESGAWVALTGTWTVEDETLAQTDATGYDYINQLRSELPAEFDLSVRMHARGDELGGGVIIGQTTIGSRRGAYVVDFTAGGGFLRWGRYGPEDGIYEYIGGLDVGTDAAEWHEIRVEVRAETTLVYLDSAYIGAFDPVDSGTAGLVTSVSSVEFDDFLVEEGT